jgi:hypothetical protein
VNQDGTIDSVLVLSENGLVSFRLAQDIQEYQILSMSNDTIFLSNGGFAVLPPDMNAGWIKEGDTTYTTIKVGIGTFALGFPERSLHVAGNGPQNVFVQSFDTTAAVEFMSTGGFLSKIYAPANTADLRIWHEGFGDIVSFKNNGKVGIGVNEPGTNFEVNGKSKMDSIQITAGAASDRVLASDANGNAYWSGRKHTLNIAPSSFDATGLINATIGLDPQNAPVLIMPDGVTSDAFYSFPLPEGFNSNTAQFRVLYSSSVAGDTFNVSLVSRGTAIGGDLHIGAGGGDIVDMPGPVSSYILLEGLPLQGNNWGSDTRFLKLQLRRRGSAPNDTNTGDLLIYGIVLEYYE